MADALTVLTWLWGTKYSTDYVTKLASGLMRNLKQPHRFLPIFVDKDDPLIAVRGCFVRLRMFDPKWQRDNGISGRVICLDLDLVITGKLDQIFDRWESFVILQGANSSNPCPFNGSVVMFRTGYHTNLWTDFSLKAAEHIKCFSFPDDQGWYWHKLPDAAGWKVGPSSGIYAYRKPGWPQGDHLPPDARMVCFPGKADPKHLAFMPWMQHHWR
jgi:hypothetical protein